ncbi:MAG: SDR family NAD(P)-dependent oxidoreductase [Hyphomicrobiales bacterium]
MLRADLTGKRALVTGGVSGIGLATVRGLAGMGAQVAANHLPADETADQCIEALVDEGLNVIAAPGDVSKPGEAEEMVQAAVSAMGGLDYLVNNAATPNTQEPIEMGDLDAMTEEFWQKILTTNVVGSFRCAKAAAPALRKGGGAVVNLASIAGINSAGSSMAYGAGKAAIINMTKNLARGLAPDVRVNAVAPGLVESPWTADWPEERREGARQTALLKRNCYPDDIAEAIIFFLAGANAVTGQTLVIDAGLTL